MVGRPSLIYLMVEPLLYRGAVVAALRPVRPTTTSHVRPFLEVPFALRTLRHASTRNNIVIPSRRKYKIGRVMF